MKKTLTSLVLAVSAVVAYGQQDPQFSQYIHNKLSYNPGYAGTNQAICAVAMYRQQWVSFPGAPKTILFGLDAPVLVNSPLHGGAGLTIISDALGNDKSLFARGSYAYHQPIGAGILGIGIEVGMIQKALSFNWIPPDGASTVGPDASIPDAAAKAITYDLGFGLYYTTPKLYVGLSSSHLPEQTLKQTTNQLDFKNARHYYVLAGYDFDINSSLKLMPSVLVKSDAKSTIFDVNCNVMWNNMVWLGANYRMTDAIVAQLGFQKVSEKMAWKVGYSYDITMSDLKNHSNNTHEVVLGYCIKLVKKVKRQSHINPRFLK
ncbi:MAG: type IX secretion system membrane protein PorP/SprF [Bacteroidota bacterium]